MKRTELLKVVVDTSSWLSNWEPVLDFALIGSAVYHDDPKDVDFLVLAKGDDFREDARWSFGPGWDLCAGQYDEQDDKWGALRKGDVNLIVTVDPEWFKGAKLANEVCALLKLQDKADRVAVYRVVRDGMSAEAARQ